MASHTGSVGAADELARAQRRRRAAIRRARHTDGDDRERLDPAADLEPQSVAGEKVEDVEADQAFHRALAGIDAAGQASTLSHADGGTRARMMQRLQVEQGNAFVQRLVSALGEQSKDGATASVQRDGRDAKISSLLRLDVRTYTRTWATHIAADLDKQMAQATLAASNPFITWGDVTGNQFIAAAMRPVTTAGMDLWDVLTATLAPTSPEAAVNRGRDADDAGMSPMEYKPAVAQELRILYTRQLNESLTRVLPRYVAAKSQKVLEEEWKANSSRLPSASADPASTAVPSVLVLKTVPDEPSQDDIAVSHPFDRLVTKALVTGLAIVDVAAYRKSRPSDAAAGRARLVDFDVEVNTGPMAWVRVSSANATPEDVAHTVYGDAALAYSVTAAPPLFGVDPQKVSKEHWPKFRAAPRTGFAAGDTTGFGPTDAAMAAPQHDEAAGPRRHRPAPAGRRPGVVPAPTVSPGSRSRSVGSRGYGSWSEPGQPQPRTKGSTGAPRARRSAIGYGNFAPTPPSTPGSAR